MEEAKKRCPECGEEILFVARKCKHCGSVLVSQEGAPVAMAAAVVAQVSQSVPTALEGSIRPAADFGVALLAIPVAAALLIFVWVGNMSLIQGPGSTLAMLGVATILLTAAVASWEASRVGMVSDRTKGSYSPIAWFFLVALLWIVGYPAYLLKRRHYGLKNLFWLGVVVMVLFVSAWGLLGAAIDERVDDLKAQFSSLGDDPSQNSSFDKDIAALDKIIAEADKSIAEAQAVLGRTATDIPATQLGNPREASDKRYRAMCTDSRISKGITLGGEPREEAAEHAKVLCRDVPVAFNACLSRGTSFQECFESVEETSE